MLGFVPNGSISNNGGESPTLIASLELPPPLETYIKFRALQYHKDVEKLKGLQRRVIKMMGRLGELIY